MTETINKLEENSGHFGGFIPSTLNPAHQNKEVIKILMKKVMRIMRSWKMVKPDTPFLRERSNPVVWSIQAGAGLSEGIVGWKIWDYL